MGFVVIDNKDMDLAKVDAWIKDSRKEQGGDISPELALEILSKTNHLGHIKPVLKNIKEKNSTKEQIKQYEEFILACVDGREMSDKATADLREMADLCGCRDKFELLNRKNKIYKKDECMGCIAAEKEEDVWVCSLDDLKVYQAKSFNYDAIFDVNENKIAYVIYPEKGEFCLENIDNFPEVLDLSMYDKVYMTGCDFHGVKEIKFKEGAEVILSSSSRFPYDLDLSMCSDVNLSGCAISYLKNLKFRDGAKVNLSGVRSLPKNLDLSMCDEVNLCGCDLAQLETLKFKEGAKINLTNAINLPKDLDVSMCSEVNLSLCNLEGVSNLKFREGSEVRFDRTENLPEDLDVSPCDKVIFESVELYEVKDLKFKEGAIVHFKDVASFPSILDLSMCEEATMMGYRMSGIKELIFKNEEQKQKIINSYKERKFKGKISYIEDKKQNVMPSSNIGMDM